MRHVCACSMWWMGREERGKGRDPETQWKRTLYAYESMHTCMGNWIVHQMCCVHLLSLSLSRVSLSVLLHLCLSTLIRTYIFQFPLYELSECERGRRQLVWLCWQDTQHLHESMTNVRHDDDAWQEEEGVGVDTLGHWWDVGTKWSLEGTRRDDMLRIDCVTIKNTIIERGHVISCLCEWGLVLPIEVIC